MISIWSGSSANVDARAWRHKLEAIVTENVADRLARLDFRDAAMGILISALYDAFRWGFVATCTEA